MRPAHINGLRVLDREPTDESYGTRYDRRTLEQMLDCGIILLDKPPGPTSHEVVAWVKKILNLSRVGHSGTLDPQVSGVLPLGLGDATKVLGVLLRGPKEYVALGRLHTLQPAEKIARVIKMFHGPIFQRPPQRSAVSRQTRIRTIHGIKMLEQKERLLLARIACESGTYVRKLYYDMGEILGSGATMIELRRVRVSQFSEDDGLVTMHQLADAYAVWKETGDGAGLAGMIRPAEEALSTLKSVVIRDSAVDALCHGAQLAVPGVLEVSASLEKGDAVAIYTQKGEAVALAECHMSAREIDESSKGHAFKTQRIIMSPDTYPRKWRAKPRAPDGSGSAEG